MHIAILFLFSVFFLLILRLFQFVKSLGAKKMPTSFDIVSHETKQLIERWKGQVKDHLTRRGNSFAEMCRVIPALDKKALELALKYAVEDWETSGKPCSAEEFVQQFLRLAWAGATQKGKYPVTALSDPVFKRSSNLTCLLS